MIGRLEHHLQEMIEIYFNTGFAGLCEDLIGREVGAVRHYCYVQNTTDGKGAWMDQQLVAIVNYGGPARLRAENSTYYNLSGYLASITSDGENDYVLDKIRDDMETYRSLVWWNRYSGGEANLSNATEGTKVGLVDLREMTYFCTTASGDTDGFTNWRTGEPNNCCTVCITMIITEII